MKQRMDQTTSWGILAALAALIGGFLWEGGHWEGLVEKTALLIVFGGTFAAVAISFPASRLRQIPESLKTAFRPAALETTTRIDELVELATIARREGVLSLEDKLVDHPDPFIQSGLQIVVDGTDHELSRQILEFEIDAIEQRMENQAKVFESAGGYAPTMGIIGTVMGLIHVLSNLADPGSLGPAIAVAFTATLYGVASANILYLPIASKIRIRAAETVQFTEMMLEGILAIQAGENPALIRKKLTAFMQTEKLSFVRKKEESEDGAETQPAQPKRA